MTDPKPDSPASEPIPTPEHANYTHKTEIEPGLSPGEEMRIVELETGERQCIAVVINIETDDETEMMANAELFAAAPEVAAENKRLREENRVLTRIGRDVLKCLEFEREKIREHNPDTTVWSFYIRELKVALPARKDGER